MEGLVITNKDHRKGPLNLATCLNHRWTIRIVLYWNTIPKAGIVLVLVNFSKLSNTNTKPIPTKIPIQKRFQATWLVQKHCKQEHITCFLWMHHFKFGITLERFTLSLTMIKFSTFSASSIFRNHVICVASRAQGSLTFRASCLNWIDITDYTSKEGKLHFVIFPPLFHQGQTLPQTCYQFLQPSSIKRTYRQLRKLIVTCIFISMHLNKELCW